jgi:hypothetical protein
VSSSGSGLRWYIVCAVGSHELLSEASLAFWYGGGVAGWSVGSFIVGVCCGCLRSSRSRKKELEFASSYKFSKRGYAVRQSRSGKGEILDQSLLAEADFLSTPVVSFHPVCYQKPDCKPHNVRRKHLRVASLALQGTPRIFSDWMYGGQSVCVVGLVDMVCRMRRWIIRSCCVGACVLVGDIGCWWWRWRRGRDEWVVHGRLLHLSVRASLSRKWR